MSLAVSVAVAVAVVVGGTTTYLVVRDELYGRVDRSLRGKATALTVEFRAHQQLDQSWLRPRSVKGRFGSGASVARIVDVAIPVPAMQAGDDAFPSTSPGRAVARSGRATFATIGTGAFRLRILAVPLGHGRALEVARPLDEVDADLDRIGDLLLTIAVGGIALGLALGLLVSGRAVAPVRRLAEVVDLVTSTRQLDRRVTVRGSDELSRLGTGMNHMLGAVEEAVSAQRQLVADASHELGTPLTSLRADVALLRRGDRLTAGERHEIVAGLDAGLTEMADLVRELVQLAEGDLAPPPFGPVRLDRLAQDVVDRVARGRPSGRFRVALEPVTIEGASGLLERAAANLIENAAKWSPPGAHVDVAVAAGGVLSVRDFGPGIDVADLPHIFERFYRANRSDGVPGFGLGLAIVRRIAETHGGTVAVELPADGGTRFVLDLRRV
jgi:two-component system sensor histidine kinase MprB